LRWIEIINARGISTKTALELERVVADIRQSVPTDKEAFVRVEIYRGAFIQNDWAIHLCWETVHAPQRRSGLGMEMSELLRPLALVDHSMWIQDCPVIGPKTQTARDAG
jgi:hypothetical protein